MVVDIGGGTTGVTVISLGGIVTNISARIGGPARRGDHLPRAGKEHSLYSLGAHGRHQDPPRFGIPHPRRTTGPSPGGRDLIQWTPRTVVLTSDEVRRALNEPVTAIVDAIRTTLDRTSGTRLAMSWMPGSCSLAGSITSWTR